MEPLKERDEATSLGHRSRFRAVSWPKIPWCRVLLGFFRFGLLGLSVPIERLMSGFSIGSSRIAESSGCSTPFSQQYGRKV